MLDFLPFLYYHIIKEKCTGVLQMFEKIITYFEENPLYFWIAVAIVALIVICIIAAIVSHCVKKSKAGGEEEY